MISCRCFKSSLFVVPGSTLVYGNGIAYFTGVRVRLALLQLRIFVIIILRLVLLGHASKVEMSVPKFVHRGFR